MKIYVSQVLIKIKRQKEKKKLRRSRYKINNYLGEFTGSCAGENNNKQKQNFSNFSNFFKDYFRGFFDKCLFQS